MVGVQLRVLYTPIRFRVCISIPYGNLWKMFKPHTAAVLRDVVFPLLCFSDEDVERWEDDPIDYVRSTLETEEDYGSPLMFAKNLIQALLKDRGSYALPLMLQFARDVLMQYVAWL